MARRQTFLLTFFVGLLTLGVLEAEYGIVRNFVRFICMHAIVAVGAVILFLVIGIVVAGQLLGWSEPSKERRSRKRARKR